MRNKLSPRTKALFEKFCASSEIHSELNVTYQDVAERVISWMHRQPDETWNELVKILEESITASEGMCFTGRISRLVSVLDGFHPGVRIAIATSDQISNRVLMVVNKGKEDGKSLEDIESEISKELDELGLSEEDKANWMTSVRDAFD
jgi:hypothetical protein